MGTGRCAVVTGRDPKATLADACTRGGVWDRLAGLAASADKAPEDLSVVVLPDLALYDTAGPTGTDPRLVEHLVDLLAERSYLTVAVGAGPDEAARWLDNRDALVLADMAGYRYMTDEGNAYDVVDLGEDLVEAPFPATSALHGSQLARPWLEADARICFAKNKTHAEHGFALCLQTLLGVLPLRDRAYHYRARLKPWDSVVDLLRATPVHAGVVDAVVSNHGSLGDRVPRPIDTDTIVAGDDVLLVDFTAAAKMGLDPYASPLNAKALHDLGLPEGYRVDGSLEPYEGWSNVHPLQAHALRRINESPTLGPGLTAATIQPNTELFPFRGSGAERVSRMAGAALAANPYAPWAYAWLAAGVDALEAWRTLADKDRLPRRELPLDLDLDAYTLDDYDAVVGYMAPLEQLVAATPADANGLRWRYLDGSVLFEYSSVLPAPFDDFVEHVDIASAINYMNDYIGGRCVPVAHDEDGRVTHQAERNVYLPQPSYLVLYGGKVIDVGKLERIHYGADEHRISWRTVKSANDSAGYDDGTVTFRRTGPDCTTVTIVARQQFALPPFWQMVNLDLVPEVKDRLVADAYLTFFDRTIENFARAWQGEDFRIGQPWDPMRGEPGHEDDEGPLAVRVRQAAERGRELVGRVRARRNGVRPDHDGELDEHGFRHFTPTPAQAAPEQPREAATVARGVIEPVAGFWRDLGRQVGKDLRITVVDE